MLNRSLAPVKRQKSPEMVIVWQSDENHGKSNALIDQKNNYRTILIIIVF